MPAELYGPFGALAALTAVVAMIIRGDLVPGYIYRLEQAQRIKAETDADRNAESLAVLAKVAVNGALPHAGPPAPSRRRA